MWSMHWGIAAISLKAARSAGSAVTGPLKLFPKANMSNRVLYVLWYPWDVFRLCCYNSRVMWEHGSSWRPDKQRERRWESLFLLYFSNVLSFTSFLSRTFETAPWYYNVLCFLQSTVQIVHGSKTRCPILVSASNYMYSFVANKSLTWNATKDIAEQLLGEIAYCLVRYYIWYGRYLATVQKSVLYCMNVCGIEIWMYYIRSVVIVT